MKIIIVIGNLIGGGSERAVCLLASQLARDGHETTILSISNNNGAYPLNDLVKVIKLPKYGNFFKDLFVRSLTLRKMFKRIDPDAIISFTTQKNVCVLLASFFLKYKVIISERNDPNSDPSNRLLRFLRKVTYWKSNGFVFQTEQAQRFFSKRIQHRSCVIPNAIDLSHITVFRGTRKKRIVTVGRLDKQKNQIMAIDAFQIASLGEQFVFDIYGEGPYRSVLEKYIESKNIKNVELKGFTDNVVECINDAAVFVLSSDYEGISNALLEALAVGVPCVSTDHPIGGARILIKDGYNGFLVPVGSASVLAEKMRELACNTTLQDTFSKNSIEYIANNFSVEKITQQWEEYILRVARNER